MDKTDAASLAIASTLAAFLVVPSLADDMPTGASREPAYVWEGNRTAAPAPGSSAMPQTVQEGKVRYLTGGIGDDERAAIEAAKPNYNLHVTSTNMNGEFNGDTQIAIRDHAGTPLLNVNAGPLFYAALPPGTYTVEASLEGQTKQQKINVGQEKPASLYFRW